MSAGTGFPYILYDLLAKESSAIVMWTSTGTAFGIRDMASFRQDVLTGYFKHNKFSSFQRQLNLYGFRKVVKGRESGCYMHPCFLRDSPEKLTEVKRGVVPPCPPCYSQKIYGSGPRFLNQDESSDSEPELVVQARGHWEKNLGPADVATHMRLGEMHMSAAAYGAARAQIQGGGAGAGGSNGGHNNHTAAAAAAAVHHLQAAQAHIHGVPGGGTAAAAAAADSRGPGGVLVRMPGLDTAARRALGPPPPDMDVGRMGPLQQHGAGPSPGNGGEGSSSRGERFRGGGGGGGGRGGGGHVGSAAMPSRARTGGLSKMFGSSRPPSAAPAPPAAGTPGGNGGSGMQQGDGESSPFMRSSSSSGMQHSPRRLQQQQIQQIQQMQSPPHMQQNQQMHRFGGASAMPEPPSQGDRCGGGGGGGGGGLGYLPSLVAAGGQEGNMPMGGPVAAGVTSSARGFGDGRQVQTSTVMSLSRLLENLEHNLEAPLEEELYTPIDKRNSFCAQMVNIAQVLEEDPSMQGMEDPRNTSYSYIAEKRRSSVSELAAYLQDLLEEGESIRNISNTPGWTLPPPLGSEATFREGNHSNGNRVTFKRTAPEDFEAYGDYGMDRSGRSGGGGSNDGAIGAAGGGTCAPSSGSFHSKRARGWSKSQEPSPFEGGGGIGRHGRRMSEARMNAKVAASPNVVQALACLVSGLPESSDSEDNNTEDAAAAAACGGAAGVASCSSPADGVGVKREPAYNGVSESNAFGGERAGAAAQPTLPSTPARRASKAIDDVVTKCSIDEALEQLKWGEEEAEVGGGEEKERGGGGSFTDGGGGALRQRASVYVLMHAIAAVDTANDEAFGAEEKSQGGVGQEVTAAAI